MKKNKWPLVSRDISWLAFNDRVLQEANDPRVPLLERLKFLGIVSSNRDEFFRVRVASLKRLARMGKKGKELLGDDPSKLLERIQRIIIRQQEKFDESWEDLLRVLQLQGVFIINEKQLNRDQGEFVRRFFRHEVLPSLVPILLDNVHKFPYLHDRSIYLMVVMKKEDERERYALLEIPTSTVSRFLVLPKDNKYIILLDDVIRYCLDELFFNFDYLTIQAYTIKLTRDAELDIEQDVTKSIVKKVAEGVKRRSKGQPTRLIYDEELPESALDYLARRMRLSGEDHPISGGRYHNFVDFIRFPSLNRQELCYKNPQPLSHPGLPPRTSIFKVLRTRDILLSFPYQSYHHILDLLREASIDPKVTRIQITLYRLSRNSQVVNTLINAIQNGKDVVVVVELQARFDEENNIRWANRLNEEGAKVIYGVPGLKMHSKLFLITRREHGRNVQYAHVGTGNFNEDTARLYCDHSLLTADKRITEEVARVFQFYHNNYKTSVFRHLIVSPFDTRKKMLGLIQKEIENAKAGRDAWLFFKMNSLTDTEIINKLYEAGQAGVKIRMIIRSICSLIPGAEGLSENIQVMSLVDKYLEHARIFIFSNNGSPLFYLASFDLMQRNIDFRSEVGVPVYDEHIREQLWRIMELQWNDNAKARVINVTQDNQYRKSRLRTRHRAQDEIYQYLSQSIRAVAGVAVLKED